MKNVKKSMICIALCMGLMVFGAWTPRPETRYADAPFISAYANETIEYTQKVFSAENTTVNNAPKYGPMGNLTNACGAVAGSVIVGFYDKYSPNLIENWESFFPNGKYRGADKVYIPAVMNELYTLMRTNVDDVGVSRYDFLDGLESYVNSKGYSIAYSQVATENIINYTVCKNVIDSNNLIVLFARPGDVYSVGYYNGYDVVTPINISGHHIMVAYGYIEISYYNESGLFRTDKYLEVVTGRQGVTDALYKISPHNLEGAYSVVIK